MDFIWSILDCEKPRRESVERLMMLGLPISLDPIGSNGKLLSKSGQIGMIGNSVRPYVAEALIRADLAENCADLGPKALTI